MIIVLQIILGLLILGVLVLIHELGHFTAAKSFGIRVLAFSIGFGKPLFKKQIGETEYRISAVPFGGYVHMSGEHPEEKPDVEPGDFTAKPIWQRAVVAIAGPLANFIFAMVCLYVLFIVGVNMPEYLMRPVVGSVADTSNAMKAGFLPGDSIVSLNGKPIQTWEQLERGLAMQLARNEIVVCRSSTLDTLVLSLSAPKTRKFPTNIAGGLQASLPAVIGDVSKGSRAEKAGLKKGDTVLSVNGKAIYSWFQLSSTIVAYDSAKGPLGFTVKRKSDVASVSVVPAYDKSMNRFLVGISMAAPVMRTIRYSPTQALPKMLDKTYEYTVMIFDVLGKLVSKQVSPKQLSGPVGIVQMSGYVALSGLGPILDFIALIGINLAVLNLMPLIITDGGLLLFLCIEAIRRKPLSVKYQVIINKIAISLFIALFLYVTINDIVRVPDIIKTFGK